MGYTVGIITVSDKGYAGVRKDLSCPAIEEILTQFNSFTIGKTVILPDDRDILIGMMRKMADEDHFDLILTTGGTGFGKRDVTPEATLEVIERRTPGVPEAMRHVSLEITSRAMLSRAEAGIRGNSLIVNLPGSPKSIMEILGYIMPSIEHGLDILQGKDAECAR
ncbi:MAG: MogA/MoaB family molybdenum cofactor biosynthesis protein [Eubacteriales bacterium]|nr:MogA/MoaB family molybdenum cofactor biosynthesis protein [Eubacteriales bacterium]MDD3199222.1 MogA/MoaB family molybdenum cofactor biosynthesis protein [Eubacteriales bacterium]MDD4121429.1 MogA/MoaB family molybdenum cofactor biosynthesis protein [Eubacteriales bacterium]MDD4629353.1 MogA/MoaB family molybdenum cofactor biosynthesis protein [Eubacteriales bacterium]